MIKKLNLSFHGSTQACVDQSEAVPTPTGAEGAMLWQATLFKHHAEAATQGYPKPSDFSDIFMITRVLFQNFDKNTLQEYKSFLSIKSDLKVRKNPNSITFDRWDRQC